MNFQAYTDDEIKRWLWLRALEWASFPAFISQPIAPILFIFYPWYLVVLSVVALSALWCLFRYSFVSVGMAIGACLAVVWLKWPISLGSSIYLLVRHQPVPALIALSWPLVAGFLSPPGKAGAIELAFAKKIGMLSPDENL